MRIILEGVVGSKAYGLNHAGSDIDTLGVFIRPVHEYLTLDTPDDSIVTHEPDVTHHDLRKYLRLALKCNPTVLELLYLDSYTFCDWQHGEPLVQMREAFLSAPAVKGAYLGYARSQLTRLKEREGDRKRKHAKHMVRLLKQGYDLYTTGHVDLKSIPPQWMNEFLDDESEWEAYFHDAVLAFDKAETALPDKPDKARVEKYLADVMYAEMIRETAAYA